MNDFRPMLYVIVILLCLTSGAMLLPMIVDLFYQNDDWKTFMFSSILCFSFGMALIFSFNNKSNKLSIRQAFLLTVSSWIIIALFASLPFMYSESSLSFTNAFFESVSGVTTTGSTVIRGYIVMEILTPMVWWNWHYSFSYFNFTYVTSWWYAAISSRARRPL